MKPHITDYAARSAANLAYVNWLRAVEDRLRIRPTPKTPRPPTTAAAIRRNIIAEL